MVQSSLERVGISPDAPLLQDSDHAKCIIEQRICDMEHQQDLMKTPNFMAPMKFRYTMTMAQYFRTLDFRPHRRRAFTLARCAVVP